MLISEKQLMRLLYLFKIAVNDRLTTYGLEQAKNLIRAIEEQQPEELKEIK